MNDSLTFGDLRSALQAPPSPTAWRRVLGTFDALPPEVRQGQAVAYVQRHLERWPARLRTLPPLLWRRWSRTLLPPEAMQFVATLHVPKTTEALLQSWLDAPACFVSVKRLVLRHAERLPLFETLWERHLQDTLSGFSVQATSDGDDFAMWLGHCPPAALKTLELQQAQLSAWGGGHLLGNKALGQLQELGLGLNRLDFLRPEQLKRAPWQAGLGALDLSGSYPECVGLGGFGALAMAKAGIFDALHTLRLSNSELHAAPQKFEPEHWPALTHLEAMNNRLAGAQVAHLIDALPTSRIQRLNLGRNPLGGPGAAALIATPWPALETLNLDDARLGQADFEALTLAKTLPRLRHLSLGMNDLAGAPLQEEGGILGTLASLHANSSRLGDDDLYRLTRALPEDAPLRELSLALSHLTARSLDILASSPLTQSLESLTLSHNRLTGPQSMLRFAQAPWPRLRALRLVQCELTEAEIDALCQASWLAQLETLDLEKNPLGPKAYDTLAASALPAPLRELYTWA